MKKVILGAILLFSMSTSLISCTPDEKELTQVIPTPTIETVQETQVCARITDVIPDKGNISVGLADKNDKFYVLTIDEANKQHKFEVTPITSNLILTQFKINKKFGYICFMTLKEIK